MRLLGCASQPSSARATWCAGGGVVAVAGRLSNQRPADIAGLLGRERLCGWVALPPLPLKFTVSWTAQERMTQTCAPAAAWVYTLTVQAAGCHLLLQSLPALHTLPPAPPH